MIIAYCRPFSGNDKKHKSKVPDLTERILNCLTKEEMELHDYLFKLRNKYLAHSDSEAWNMRPTNIDNGEPGEKLILPLHDAVRAPLLPKSVGEIKIICDKLMEEIFQRRMILENELIDFL